MSKCCDNSGGGGASVANPSGSIGLSAVNGIAATALRSDGHPPLSQAIVPTWTGIHTFANQAVFNNLVSFNFKNTRCILGQSAGYGLLGSIGFDQQFSRAGIPSVFGVTVTAFTSIVPANLFDQNLRMLRGFFRGSFENNTNLKSIGIVIDGSIYQFNRNTLGGFWTIDLVFIRTDTDEIYFEFFFSDLAGNANLIDFIGGMNFANAITLDFTLDSTASDDIVAKHLLLDFHQ